ncbi:four-carbon acid sugar kinase family protein (plasmid) [Thioclava sp. 'Guangxiensis']|uniref:four-carbon acid sugar kinase family protein n=1 Tax=Thioclava sp. 'Guangxiensis' TaxID=3149044 RepID=UPI0032C495CC
MTDRIMIMADDLTGALDSAVAFADGTRRVIVARSPETVSHALRLQPDVLAINTASREGAPARAREQVSTALAALSPDRFSIIFKKIDSRLKGHIATETAMLATWAARRRLLVCPAIPDMGRHVAQGALCGAGVKTPISVTERLGEPEGMTLDIPDVSSITDLDRIVENTHPGTLWVGARGLAFALARSIGCGRPILPPLAHPLLIANGSRDPVTQVQIAALPPDFLIIEAENGALPSLFAIAPETSMALSITDGRQGLSGTQAAREFALSTADLAQTCTPRSLVICGGETAQAILDRMGVEHLYVIGELRPGLPLCRIETPWGPMCVVTKSGGFGAQGLLASLVAGHEDDMDSCGPPTGSAQKAPQT